MRWLAFSTMVLAGCVATGCDRSDKVNVKAPGVNVQVDKSTGIKVDAPGVNVDVSPDGEAKVKVDGDGSK
ncbi:MAG: hypothetical protein HYX69_15440 [Planctomycetia bacterium]|nr:hypothetical protein [Planctomycetia bacterium]